MRIAWYSGYFYCLFFFIVIPHIHSIILIIAMFYVNRLYVAIYNISLFSKRYMNKYER